MNKSLRPLIQISWLLRLTYGLYWGIIGIDKFFGLLTESENRVGGATLALMPLSLKSLLQTVGVIEIFIAFLILTKWPKLGTLLGIFLMALIFINLIMMRNHFDIAVHGAAICCGMIAFLALSFLLDKMSISSRDK